MKRNIFFRWSLVFILSLTSFLYLLAQDPPIKWEEIPFTDLEMKSWPQDTNASAVILCDYGESHLNNNLNLVFNRHQRVKILTTKGYAWGTYSIGLYTEEKIEHIYNIEGITYSLDEQGKILKTELKEKDIFEEKADEKHTRYKFTLPALKPGCVIDVRYSIESESIYFIKDWTFQHSEPVRWSEYRIRSPKTIAYSAVYQGYEPFVINETQDEDQIFSGVAQSYIGETIAHCNHHRWAVQNIPALRDEPYITTIEDYVNKVDIQLAGYAFIGGGKKQVLNSWEALAKELIEHKSFGEIIDDTRRVRKQAGEIVAGLTSQEDKMKAIYNWVAKSIVWSGNQRVFAEQEVNDVLELKRGNNAEITFLLLSLLKSVGINGDPVILSTRSNGKIQDLYPILSQFNYVLARVTIGSERYYLDATDPLRPMELLPAKVLNVRGLVIKKEGYEWVSLVSPNRYNTASLALVHLYADGSLSGTIENLNREYASLFVRRDLMDKKDLDIAKESFETEQAGIIIDSVTIEGKDSIQLPLKMKAWISSSSYAQTNGDLMYINPHILQRRNENPFKSRIRKFPIDYSYMRSHTAVVKLAIPDSFIVKESLYNQSFSVGPDLAIYSRRVQIDSNQFQMVVKLEIKATKIKPKFYTELRDFYTHIVAAEAEQLVLARIKKPVIPAPAVKPEQKTSKKKIKK